MGLRCLYIEGTGPIDNDMQLINPPRIKPLEETPPGVSNRLNSVESKVPHSVDHRVMAMALANLLKVSGGLSRLSSLSPHEKKELAAKVQAAQRHLKMSQNNDMKASHKVAAAHFQSLEPQISMPRPVEVNPPNVYVAASNPDVRPPLQSAPEKQAAQVMPVSAASVIQRLLRENGPLVSAMQQQTQGPNYQKVILGCLKELVNRNATENSSRGIASMSSERFVPSERTLPCEETLRIEPAQPPGYSLSYPPSKNVETMVASNAVAPPSFSPEAFKSVRDASTARMKRAYSRLQEAKRCPNSTEMKVWKLRRVTQESAVSGSHLDGAQRATVPIWDGVQYVSVSTNENVVEHDVGTKEAEVMFTVWWDLLFRGGSDAQLASEVPYDFLIPAGSNDLKDESSNGHGVGCITTAFGSLDSSIDVCYFGSSQVMVSQLYPPSIRHPTESTKLDEQQYTSKIDAKDRFLQEILRGKLKMLNDLSKPIPQIISDLNVYHPSPHPPESERTLTGSSGSRPRRAAAIAAVVDMFESASSRILNEPDTASPTRQEYPPFGTRRGGRRGGRSMRAMPENEEMVSPRSSDGFEKAEMGKTTRDGTLASSFVYASQGKSARSPQGSYKAHGVMPGGSSYESDFDLIKRRSGWHPYVWYLMCRRPELYGVGIRARVVARVAGWEWDEIQKLPELLKVFLERIHSFIDVNPVPRSADKKDAKEYKHFAANSVRTPWYKVETNAVKRALRDLDAIGVVPGNLEVESDSALSDSRLSPTQEDRTQSNLLLMSLGGQDNNDSQQQQPSDSFQGDTFYAADHNSNEKTAYTDDPHESIDIKNDQDNLKYNSTNSIQQMENNNDSRTPLNFPQQENRILPQHENFIFPQHENLPKMFFKDEQIE